MAATIRLVQGDDLPGVSFYIRDSNKGAAGQELDRKDPSTWAPVNLAGCSLRTAISPIGEDRQIDTAIIAIVDAAAGKVILHLDDCVFFDEIGQYDCEVTVTFPNGQQTVYDRIVFDVKERIHAPSSN